MHTVLKDYRSLVVVLFVALFACNTNEAIRKQFRIEKIYFRAEKTTEAILINPSIAPITDFNKAVSLFRQVVQETDVNAPQPAMESLAKSSLMRIAQLEMMQDRIDSAIVAYREILERFQADEELAAMTRLALGQLYEQSMEYRDAIATYAGLLPNLSSRIEPANPNGFLVILPYHFAHLNGLTGAPSTSNGAYEQSAKIYREIIATSPKSKAALLATNYLAALLAENGKTDELVDLLEAQISNSSDSSSFLPEYLYLKALLLRRQGRRQEAVNAFENLLADYPTDEVVPRVRLEMAKINLDQRNFAQARQMLKEILEKNKHVTAIAAQAQSEMARSFEMEGRWDLAMNEYRWLSKQYETFPAALAAPLHIANYYMNSNDHRLAEKAFSEAVAFYQSIIGKYPKSVMAGIAQEQIANCFIAQKKWDEAISAASNIDKVLENNVGRVSTYLLLGAIHESRGQFGLAAKVYREFIEHFPQHPLTGQLKEKVEELMNS